MNNSRPPASLLPISALGGLFGRSRLTDVRQDCVLCDAPDSHVVCVPCAIELPRSVNACPSCAAANHISVCGACISEPPAFDASVAAFQYLFPLDRLVQSFKFSANLALVDFFAEALAAKVRAQQSDVPGEQAVTIIALPLANGRLATRGFNQSALIADQLGRRLGLAVAHSAMLRIRETPPQAGLSRQERLKNIKGAFDCAGKVEGKHVALVDDVMTTGATLS
ncbi:MAG: ComF family protein, partial [Pseudomonadota bacterium]